VKESFSVILFRFRLQLLSRKFAFSSLQLAWTGEGECFSFAHMFSISPDCAKGFQLQKKEREVVTQFFWEQYVKQSEKDCPFAHR
jgi:hypothetical protein